MNIKNILKNIKIYQNLNKRNYIKLYNIKLIY